MLKVDFYCSVVTHYTKMLSIFVHYKSHIFAKCENMSWKTSNLVQQQRFSPFLTLFVGRKTRILVESNMPNSKPCKDAFTNLDDTISSFS
jgi:hypothetical protein